METVIEHSGAVSEHFVADCTKIGHLLYWHRFGGNSIQVRQHKQFRWLLINQTLQSIIERSRPNHLLFPHLQIFAQYWQTLTPPKRVLELGLGGGAIRNYLHHTYPDTELISVERNADIIHCYKRYFGGAHDTTLRCADAEQVLCENEKYDWIIIDLFSELDAPLFLYKHRFYDKVRNVLNKDGHVFINFLAHHDSQLQQLTHLLITCFGRTPNIVDVKGYANRLVFLSP
ncbi:spermidine synthase [Pseudoalteromonas pernae]|uniref:spermidine synthase n=1 Tax=Pseudoalteromonas pernae TaxID=3118054 RepID=UPI0032423E31